MLEIVALVGAFRVKGLSGITEDLTDLNDVMDDKKVKVYPRQATQDNAR